MFETLVCSCKYLPVVCLSHQKCLGSRDPPFNQTHQCPHQGRTLPGSVIPAERVNVLSASCPCLDHFPEVVLRQKLRIKQNLELLQKPPGQPRKGVLKKEPSRESCIRDWFSYFPDKRGSREKISLYPQRELSKP